MGLVRDVLIGLVIFAFLALIIGAVIGLAFLALKAFGILAVVAGVFLIVFFPGIIGAPGPYQPPAMSWLGVKIGFVLLAIGILLLIFG